MAEDNGSVLAGLTAGSVPPPPAPAPPKPPIDLSSTYTSPQAGPVTKGVPQDKSHIEIETPKPVKPQYALPVDQPEKQPTQTAVSHTFWERVKDFNSLPSDQYFKKYAADDQKTHDAVQKALGVIIPFYRQASEAQPELEKTRLGKQTGEFAQEQLAHPEQFFMPGSIESEGAGAMRTAISGIGRVISELPGAITVKPAGEPLPAGDFVYHATDKSRAEAIQKEGLRPNTWFAKTPQDAMRSGATPISGNRTDLRVYAVPTHEIKPTAPDIADIGAREVEKGRFLQSSEAHKPSHEVTGEGHVVREIRPVEKPQPETVTKAELKPEIAQKASEAAKTGGFTVHPETGETPTTGFAVEVHPETRAMLDHPATAEDISKLYTDNKKLFDENPEFHIGGYGNELNVTAVVPDEGRARTLAERLDQKSIWDFAGQREIETGGKGEKTSFPDYPLEQRLRDLRGQEITPRETIEKEGLVYKGELIPGSNVHMVEHPEHPGKTAAFKGPVTAEKATEAINRKLKEFGIEAAQPKMATGEYHPDLQKIVDKYGTNENAYAGQGASFITPDGKFVHLPSGKIHTEAIKEATGENIPQYSKYGNEEERPAFLDTTGAIRVRFSNDRGGPTAHISVPAQGVTQEQIPAIQQSIAQAGRYGNVVMERADITPETKDRLSMTKEFPRPADAENYLRQIEAHPDQHGVEVEQPKTELPASPALQRLFDKTGTDWQSIRNHEAGHAILGADAGMPPEEMRSHLHPELKGIEAGAQQNLDMSAYGEKLEDGSFHISPETLENNLEKFLDMYMAGGALQEHMDGISTDDNPGMNSDIRAAHRILHALGMDELERENFIADSQSRVKERLTDPRIHDIVRKYTAEREEGLDEGLHMSADRVRQMVKEVQELKNEGDTNEGQFGRLGEESGRVGEESIAGKEGRGTEEVVEAGQPKIAGSSVPLLKNPLPVKSEGLEFEKPAKEHKGVTIEPTGEGGRPVIIDLHRALDAWAEAGKPVDDVKKQVAAAKDEIAHQIMANGGEGKGWYRALTNTAINTMKQLHPELEDPNKATLFKALWVAMSYGNDPQLNMDQAERAYSEYKKTGQIPVMQPTEPGEPIKYWAGRSGNMGTIRKTQMLIDKYGEEGAAKWLTTKHPVSEIRDEFKDKISITGLRGKGNEQAYGATAFGPKGGAFFLNLNGINDHTTVDVWGARTLRRYLGTLEENIAPEQQQSASPDKTPTRQEIEQFHNIVSGAAEKLKLDKDDVQALLWYYEHELYKAHGVGEEALDYAGAAKNTVAKRGQTVSALDFIRGVQRGQGKGPGSKTSEGQQSSLFGRLSDRAAGIAK